MATRTFGFLLPGLISAWKVQTCIEIGVANGFTTSALGRSLAASGADGVLVTCDIDQHACEIARQIGTGLPIRHLVLNADSTKVDWHAVLKEAGRQTVDLCLIDGDHSYEAARADIERCAAVLRSGGFLVLHDYTDEHPGVRRAVDEFADRSGWARFVLPEDRGTGSYTCVVLQKPLLA